MTFDKEKYQNLNQRYREALAKKDYNRARNIVEEIKKIDPKKGWYFDSLILAFSSPKPLSVNIQKERIRKLKKALSYDKKYASGWRALGYIYIVLHKYKNAENSFLNSKKYSNDDLLRNDARLGLVSVYLAYKKYKTAERLLKEIYTSKNRPVLTEIAPHFISVGQATNNPKLVKKWVKLGLRSVRIIAKSGKKAYGHNAYKKIEENYINILKNLRENKKAQN